jgi:hypothetical protein
MLRGSTELRINFMPYSFKPGFYEVGQPVDFGQLLRTP